MNILVPDFMPDCCVAQMSKEHDVRYEPELASSRSALVEAAPWADVIIVRGRTQVRGELLDALVRCKLVGRQGAGLDNIDLPECARRGIKVVSAPGANARSVAEYVIAMSMLLLRKGAYDRTAEIADGLWPRSSRGEGFELVNRTLGIVGFGAIGRCTAQLALALGMSVATWDRDPAASDPNCIRHEFLDELFRHSDVISVHVPLTAGTTGLIGERLLSLMRDDAILINAARGGVVDEAALVDAVRHGRIGGAAVDVFKEEPLGPDSVFSNPPANLRLSTHIAGVTEDSDLRIAKMVAEAILRETRYLAS